MLTEYSFTIKVVAIISMIEVTMWANAVFEPWLLTTSKVRVKVVTIVSIWAWIFWLTFIFVDTLRRQTFFVVVSYFTVYLG